MTVMPGNPDYDNAKLSLPGTILSSDEDTATIQSILIDHASATLALAYEQRTAALVDLYVANPTVPGIDYEALGQQITARLGLGDK